MLIIRTILDNRIFLWVLFFINLFGTIYGYIWYEPQISVTPIYFIPFVPDSPTASLFFTIWLLFYLCYVRLPYIEALAVTSLFKYGIWAVVMNVLVFIIEGSLSWQGYMLIASHGAMAIQGILYFLHYQFRLKHLAIAGIVLLHNDMIDYVFEMMPIYGPLSDYMGRIGYFTFWLSVITIIIVYHLMKKETKLNS